jgi:hypothetical protein
MATRGGQVKGDKGMGGGARGKEKRKAIHTHTYGWRGRGNRRRTSKINLFSHRTHLELLPAG